MRIFDRKKDMINRAGYKVYSVEVENVKRVGERRNRWPNGGNEKRPERWARDRFHHLCAYRGNYVPTQPCQEALRSTRKRAFQVRD